MDADSLLELPCKNDWIVVVVTAIVSATRFYVQIPLGLVSPLVLCKGELPISSSKYYRPVCMRILYYNRWYGEIFSVALCFYYQENEAGINRSDLPRSLCHLAAKPPSLIC